MIEGDVLINPWVSKFVIIHGEKYLNPDYATIYLGGRKCLDFRGRIVEFCFTKDDSHQWEVVGHVNLKDILKQYYGETE